MSSPNVSRKMLMRGIPRDRVGVWREPDWPDSESPAALAQIVSSSAPPATGMRSTRSLEESWGDGRGDDSPLCPSSDVCVWALVTPRQRHRTRISKKREAYAGNLNEAPAIEREQTLELSPRWWSCPPFKPPPPRLLVWFRHRSRVGHVVPPVADTAHPVPARPSRFANPTGPY